MKIGDQVKTPRFLNVRIAEVFESEGAARKEGFTEPTHFDSPDYEIHGKFAGINRMIFAAVKR